MPRIWSPIQPVFSPTHTPTPLREGKALPLVHVLFERGSRVSSFGSSPSVNVSGSGYRGLAHRSMPLPFTAAVPLLFPAFTGRQRYYEPLRPLVRPALFCFTPSQSSSEARCRHAPERTSSPSVTHASIPIIPTPITSRGLPCAGLRHYRACSSTRVRRIAFTFVSG